MSVETIDARILQRLYAVFRLRESDYITSVKLVFVYERLLPVIGADEIFMALSLRRQALRRSSNLRTLDAVYTEAFEELLRQNGRCAPPGARAPSSTDYTLSGWRL